MRAHSRKTPCLVGKPKATHVRDSQCPLAELGEESGDEAQRPYTSGEEEREALLASMGNEWERSLQHQLSGEPDDGSLGELASGLSSVSGNRQANDEGKHPCLVLRGKLRPVATESTPFVKQRKGSPVDALVDSGSTHDFVTEAVVKEMGWVTTAAASTLTVAVANGQKYKADRVVALVLELPAEDQEGRWGLYTYETNAYVLPLGVGCQIILGQTWLRSFDDDGAHTIHPKQGSIQFRWKGEPVRLSAKKESTGSEAALQAVLSEAEIVSPEEGRRLLQQLRRKGSTEDRVPFIAQLRPRREAMVSDDDEQQHRTIPLRARALSGKWVVVEDVAIQEELRRRGTPEQQRLRVRIHVKSGGRPASLQMVTVDDRDELYPFEGVDTKEDNNSAQHHVLATEDPRRRLVEAILEGKLKDQSDIKSSTWASFGLTDIVAEAEGRCSRLQTLRRLIGAASEGDKVHTLGNAFWTNTFKESLSAEIRAEYEGWVIREDLPANAPPNATLAPAAIRLRDDWSGEAPFQRSRRMAPKEEEVCRAQLQELLEKGLIVHSASAFGAPVIVLPKPHSPGKWRMVIDYRKLNELTVADKYPLPCITTLIEKLQGKKVFSTFDLCSGFYNIPVYGPHQERTAMSTPFGAFEWRFMPMGLKNSPAIFMRNLQKVFHDMPDVLLFVDDGAVGTETVEENFELMCRILDRLAEYSLVIKGSKLHLFQTKVEFLGYTLSADGLRPQHDKVESIRNWPLPRTVAEVRGFLGLASFYRRFVYNFSDKAAALNEFTKKGANVPVEAEWTAAQRESFEVLKNALCTAPVLALPDKEGARDGSKPYLVQCDASGYAMGAVLMQDHGDGWQPVAFASKTFTPAETQYHTAERELRALVWATTEVFRPYIMGTQYEIQGDHRALATLRSGRELSNRQRRWNEHLEENNVPSMTFVKGSTLAVPDALSRHAVRHEREAAEARTEGLSVSEALKALEREQSAPNMRQLRPSILEQTMRARDDQTGEGAVVCTMLSLAQWPLSPGQARDTQDWKFDHGEFERWEAQTQMRFMVDAFCDPAGHNRQVECYWSDALAEEWEGLHIWGNGPFTDPSTPVLSYLTHLQRARDNDVETSAVLVLPYFPGAEWEQQLSAMPNKELMHTYPAGSYLFHSPDGRRPPTRWPVHIWWFKRGAEAYDGWFSSQKRRGERRARVAAQAAAMVTRNAQRTAGEGLAAAQKPAAPASGASGPVRAVASRSGGEEPTFLSQVREQSVRDTAYQELLTTTPEDRVWTQRGGLLWRRDAGRIQLVVPQSTRLRNEALRDSHDAPMAGHFGVRRTLARLRIRFWWKGMAADTQAYCESCIKCQTRKSSTKSPGTEYHVVEYPVRRWEAVNVDFVSGLPMTVNGNDAVFTVTDRVTKMVHLVALGFNGSTVAVVARLFRDHVWKHHGMPLRIISDRDPRFTAALWMELCELLGVEAAMTTAYHPQGNGGAERTNGTMEAYMRVFCDKHGANWDEHLATAEYAMNDSVNASTGQTPFVLNHGESPNAPLDYYLQAAGGAEVQKSAGSQFVERWSNALQAAREAYLRAQQAYKKTYDKKRASAPHFHVGEFVLLDLHHVALAGERVVPNKFQARYHPFKVLEVQRRDDGKVVNYKLQLPKSMGRVHDTFHESKLHKLVNSDVAKWPLRSTEPPPPPVTVEGKNEFEVERVTDSRVRWGREEWFVVWKGYDETEGTWESYDAINTGGICEPWRKFEAARGGAPSRTRRATARAVRGSRA